MSSKVWRGGKCGLCGQGRSAECHIVNKPGFWKRILGLAWPRWIHNNGHKYQDVDAVIRAEEDAARLRRKINRRRRKAS